MWLEHDICLHTTTAACRAVLQLFELLTTFVGKSQFKTQVQAALKDIVYVSIAYLQMTQVVLWACAATVCSQATIERADSVGPPPSLCCCLNGTFCSHFSRAATMVHCNAEAELCHPVAQARLPASFATA